MSEPVVSLKSASKIYRLGNQWLYALKGVDLQIEKGETLAVVGPSGSERAPC